MACAGYLTYDSTSGRFALPPAHAPVVAEEDGLLFLGGLYQILAQMWKTLDDVVEAFRTGGGLPQTAYDPQTWAAMERETAPTF